jgi:type VI secretion system protein ImpK
MTEETATVFYPVVTQGLRLKDRLDRGDTPEFDKERNELSRLLTPMLAQASPDYLGDNTFLGIRYALACWLDEILIGGLKTDWERRWNEKKLETETFNTNQRFWKFWEQAQNARVRAGIDALEAYFLCIMLGFRGKALEDPGILRQWTDEARRQISKDFKPFRRPPERVSSEMDPKKRLPPRRGRDRVQRMVLIGSVSLLFLMITIILSRALF